MNRAKLESAERSLNSAAKKVLAAVPIQESWDITLIIGELRRTGGNPDHKVVLGCLGALKEARLIREPHQGKYQRLDLREPEAAAPEASREPESRFVAIPLAAAPKGDALDRIANLSTDLRKLGAALSNAASQLDDLAIEMEERFAQIDADGQKLRQLQALLRSIST